MILISYLYLIEKIEERVNLDAIIKLLSCNQKVANPYHVNSIFAYRDKVVYIYPPQIPLIKIGLSFFFNRGDIGKYPFTVHRRTEE